MHMWGFLRYTTFRYLLFGLIFIGGLLFYTAADAATIREYSDRLSDSAPSASSNHTINFKTAADIPVNGFIRFTPEDGDFNIPATDFYIHNVALYVAPNASSPYVLRDATSTPTATEDGVTIVSGSSGHIEVTLNSTTQIDSGSYIRLLIGNHTDNATTTDLGIINPSATSTYDYYLTTGIGGSTSQVTGKYAIVENISMPSVDTTETIPPRRFNGAPSGFLSGTTVSVQFSLETNEFSRCRYSTASGTPYFSMGQEFGNVFTTVHSKTITVSSSTVYTFYIRCIDDEGNENIDDFIITFEVREPPEGTPGEPGDQEGGGDSSGGGDGDSGTGEGDPSGGSSETGGTSGGGGGGGGSGSSGESEGEGTEGGGFGGTTLPYQIGDGRVTITGYAFPRSDIIILVDGYQAEKGTADADGRFSLVIDEIARGAYTFGTYAIDADNVKSSTFSTTFTVTGARGSTLSNVNIMPSIAVDPDPVDPNTTVTFSGYSIPDATVTIENQNDKSSVTLKTFTTTSDGSGAWSVDVSTAGFGTGTWKVRAKAKQDGGVSTEYSNFTFYGVGEEADGPLNPDLNRDGFVNLIDFSILLFWWNTDGGASSPPADINRDGRVSLTDFSIMIFNWTG